MQYLFGGPEIFIGGYIEYMCCPRWCERRFAIVNYEAVLD